MKLTNIFGTDVKESLKKIYYRYKNRGFKPYIVEKKLYHTDFKFYVANLEGQQWYDQTSNKSQDESKEWLWPEMEFVKNKICKKGDVILECGGHHGLTAVVISKWIGEEGHVYTFEPNSDNLAIIRKNININSSKNITVIPNAVGSEHGNILISHSNSNSYILQGNENVGIEVPIVKIDDFADKKIDVIKIDVEGFEFEVLKGATEILKTRPRLAIELHLDMMQRYGATVDQLLSLIEKNYDLWIQLDIYSPPVQFNRSVFIPDRCHLFALPK
ncbi:FkbM family methyltransferase [Mucilaginibacter sp. HD30]